MHEHYAYKMKFNNIKMSHCGTTCELNAQSHKKDLQSSKKYWKEHETDDYIAFVDKSHCTTLSTVLETIQASSATADRDYNLVVVPNAEHLGLKVNPRLHYITERINFFTSGVTPTEQTIKYMERFSDEVLQIVLEKGGSVSDIVSDIVTLTRKYTDVEMSTISLDVDQKVQFNKWLFKLIEQEIQTHGFKVEVNQLNKSIIPNCFDYSTSKADGVIYHSDALFQDVTHVRAMAIVVHDNSSESDVDIDSIDDIVRVETNGYAFEMKSNKVNEAAVNECMYNMFGTATRLVTWALQLGKVVEKSTMYGVVAAMGKPDTAFVLKLCINFNNGVCDYKISNETYKFTDAVNAILHKLLCIE